MGCALIQGIAISVTIHCIASNRIDRVVQKCAGLSPIVAADPVTYVVMAHGFYFFDDTATLPDASN
jgi:hypothetical protein